MSFTVILLALVLTANVRSQSSPATLPVIEVLTLQGTYDNDSKNTDADSESLVPSPSLDRFSFTEADAKQPKPKVEAKEVNDLASDTDAADALVMFEKILEEDDKASTGGKNVTNEEKDDDEDSDDDEVSDDDEDDDIDDGDEIDGEFNVAPTNPIKFDIAPKRENPPSFRRQGDLNSDSTDSLQSRQDSSQNSPISYSNQIKPVNSEDSIIDGSPLLLTQGGYRRPYQRRMRFNDQSQRLRPASMSEASETVETPVENENTGERPIQPQIEPQIAYAPAYQQQMGFANGPMYQHPFAHPNTYLNANGPAPQNGYYNVAPHGFPEFAANNFQQQFPHTDDPAFQSMFQPPPRHMLQNSGLVFQSQPIYPTPMSSHPQRPISGFNPFSSYPTPDNYEGTPRPDYSTYFRIPAPVNPTQMQVNPNYYRTPFHSHGNGFQAPTINLLPNYPRNNEGPIFTPPFLPHQTPNGQANVQNTDQLVLKQQQDSDSGAKDEKPNEGEQINTSPNKEDPTSVPFGNRIQSQNEAPEKTEQGDVFIRYPSEAGYATEETLPVQNTSEKTTSNDDEIPQKPAFPFFAAPNPYARFSNPDPYRNALNLVQQGILRDNASIKNDNNITDDKTTEQLSQNVPFPLDPALARPQSPLFESYHDRSLPSFERGRFYAPPGGENPFNPSPIFAPRNYHYSPPVESAPETNETPMCAKGTNASLCFNDPEYPRRELMYALNSDSYLLDRLVMPDQELDVISLVEQNTTENADSDGNYICKSDLKYGMPLRAKNIKGIWKVIVNVERAIGRGKFMQPVRLEVCRNANEPCSFTSDVKTACVQKYSLQRLLSWDSEKNVHNDVYKLPVACSCQIVGVPKKALES